MGCNRLQVSRWARFGLAAWLAFIVVNASADMFGPSPKIQSQNTPSIMAALGSSDSASFATVTIPVTATGLVILGVAASVLGGLSLRKN
ncbi:MAG: hypothetical protein OES26_16765 [Gammaproteobacteria bacterium]|nr:hypothetical protein [Gammaproteobacteria bacterium]